MQKYFLGMMALAITLIITTGGCKKDTPPAAKTTYQLLVKDQLGVSGTITFTQTSSSVTTVSITLTGSDSAYHPAYIRSNSAIESGGVLITLNPVVGGTSTTQVTALDNHTAINYSQLIMYDGYADVDESSLNLGLIIAEGDIGGNALTSTSINYALDTVGILGVSGTALFAKRVNGNTLVSVSLTGTIAGATYPEAIHLGSVTTVGGGPVAKTLNTVNGSTGKGYTNIRALDDSTVVTYSNLLVYDGYLAVQQSAVLTNTICQGNIGTH
jgi:hypothetical protein